MTVVSGDVLRRADSLGGCIAVIWAAGIIVWSRSVEMADGATQLTRTVGSDPFRHFLGKPRDPRLGDRVAGGSSVPGPEIPAESRGY